MTSTTREPATQFPSVDTIVQGVLDGDRTLLARAITLIESKNKTHQLMAEKLLNRLLSEPSKSIRIGITGVPGVGKSTFIDAFGSHLIEQGHQVAVLAVDPSSTRTGGSILGDKTRMNKLSLSSAAFIRPSPSSGALGGVTEKTRETIILCEAAGYDVILVETVGVGQSEVSVSAMTDFFLVLMLAGAGDELQGIKRGLLELADAIVINKADGDNLVPAKQAAMTYKRALHVMQPRHLCWTPPVLTCSSLQCEGIDVIWDSIQSFRKKLTEHGLWNPQRELDQIDWMWSLVRERLMDQFTNDEKIKNLVPGIESQVKSGQVSPISAARQLCSLNSPDENIQTTNHKGFANE